MHKKSVPNASQTTLNIMVKLDKISKDSCVKSAQRHLYGNLHIIRNIASNVGLNYGLQKVTVFDSYVLCLDTVLAN